jgi:riboflavin synthase
MFTGIIETVGVIRETRSRGDTKLVWFDAPSLCDDLSQGDSIAVDGACLTVEATDRNGFAVTAVGTTLSRTVASRYDVGMPVNLERAMAMGDRLDGHIVQGHVDGLGSLERVHDLAEYRKLDFRIPVEVWHGTILHGSIALNGISLTVNALDEPDLCQVAIIPVTWERTNLRYLTQGDPVNVEGDLIGKYVGRLLAPHGRLRETGASDSAGSPRPEEMGP